MLHADASLLHRYRPGLGALAPLDVEGHSPHPWHWQEAAGNSARIGSIGLGGMPWVQAGYTPQQRLENVGAQTSGAASTSASDAVGRRAGSGCWIGLGQRRGQLLHHSGKQGHGSSAT